MQTIAGIIAAVLLIGGGWYLYTKNYMPQAQQPAGSAEQADMGTYAYTCSNGVDMVMVPSADLKTIEITMHDGPVTLTQVEGTSSRYKDGWFTFVGAGEEVTLSYADETTTCTPVPSADMAPFNWGDLGEGGGVQQDVALIVSESIAGKWQSTDDAKFFREFTTDGHVTDSYEGAEKTDGVWVAYSAENVPESVQFPVDENAVYLQLVMEGSQDDALNFKVAKLTPETLELIYMDRGGVLSFTRVQ